EAKVSASKGGLSRGKEKKDGRQPPPVDTRKSQPLTPVHAALVEFVSQTFVVPNTPALTYGFLCARKFGFQGDMALFLQEVIDDFYSSRGINYYGEVLEWEDLPESLATASPRAQGEEASATGTGSR
ncbi:MAG: hypothetical protein ABIF09_08295, partial [Gemmatimonadota bacterium]